jgi:pimeloyl-ACP methyl ester carboxylesterase
MEREVRYCTSEDGTRIAYSVEGEGPALFVGSYVGESFALDHLIPEYKGFNEAIGRGRTVIRLDIRGTGLSQRDVKEISADLLLQDLEAVISATKVSGVAIWAPIASGPNAVSFAVRHQELVSRLILWGTSPALSAFWTREFVEGLAQMCRLNWELGARTISDLSSRLEFPEASTHLQRALMESVSGET